MENIIFETPIWKTELNYVNKHKLISEIQNNYKENPNQTPKLWNCFIHSSYEKESQIPEDLTLLIEKKSNEFLDAYNKKIKIKGEYLMSDIWYNVCGPGQFQEPHTHGDCLFSGCYYLKFDDKYHHQTTFYNPNFDFNFSNLSNDPYFCFNLNCKEDDLIIFPSNLKHGTKGVKKNSLNNLRITISFNIYHTSLLKNRSKFKSFKSNYS